MKRTLVLIGAMVVMAMTSYAQNDSTLIKRILAYRAAGIPAGAPRSIALGYRVDDTDYLLMGSENGAVLEDYPGRQRYDILTGAWFDILPGSVISTRDFPRQEKYNGIVESAYLEVTRPEYRPSPEEIIWQMRRVQQLKDKGVGLEERIRIMTQERRSQPWRSVPVQAHPLANAGAKQ